VSNGDQRWMSARSQYGYTDRSVMALDRDAEAVPADYQRQISELARRKWRQREADAYTEASNAINGALDQLQATVPKSDAVRSGIRAVRRSTAALGRRFDASI
jgi:hypothetical protein